MSDDISKDDEGMDEQCRLVWFLFYNVVYILGLISKLPRMLIVPYHSKMMTYPFRCSEMVYHVVMV